MSDTETVLYQTHLKGHRMSGRVVRYRILSTKEIDDIERVCLKSATKDTTTVEYNADVITTAMRAMLVAVSDPCASIDQAKNWRDLDAATLAGEWDKLFTQKDAKALKGLYVKEHVVTEQELNDIMGGVQAVLAE